MKNRNKTQHKRTSLPLWVGIVLFALAIIFAVVRTLPKPESNNQTSLPVEVSVSQASDLRDSGAFILDVREQSEWNEIHIPDSTLIPLNELENRLGEVPKDKQIVVVCRSGNRSSTGRDILLNAGFSDVTSMAGGIRDWQANNLPTVSGP